METHITYRARSRTLSPDIFHGIDLELLGKRRPQKIYKKVEKKIFKPDSELNSYSIKFEKQSNPLTETKDVSPVENESGLDTSEYQVSEKCYSRSDKKILFKSKLSSLLVHKYKQRKPLFKNFSKSFMYLPLPQKPVVTSANDEIWTPSEDIALLDFVEQIGKKWKLLGSKLKKPRLFCRERYYELKEKQRPKPWASDEDYLLSLAAEVYNRSWIVIQNHFPGRSSINLKQRFHYILRNEYFQNCFAKKLEKIRYKAKNNIRLKVETSDFREKQYLNMLVLQFHWNQSAGNMETFLEKMNQQDFLEESEIPLKIDKLFELPILDIGLGANEY